MSTGDWLRIGVAIAAIGVIAFATAVLIGFAASSHVRISELATHESGRARSIQDLLERSHQLQATMIFLDTAAVAAASALVTATVIPRLKGWSVALVVFCAIVLMIVLGRAVPRAIALRLPDRVALSCARFARALVLLFAPLTAAVDGIASLILGLLRVPSPSLNTALATEEELIQLVRDEAGDNRIEEEEVDLVNSIFRFTDTAVRDIMVPRVDIVGIPRQATVRDAVTAAREGGHSRVPVYDGSLDRIVGVVYAKDLLRYVGQPANTSVIAVMRTPLFVPDGKPVPDLLRELQARRIHMAIVVDEYGGTAGLVTIEDIIEEIVGEIQDEYDVETPLVEGLPDGVFVVSGRLELGDFEQLMSIKWVEDEEERAPLAGFILDRLGRIPTVGEELWVGDVKFTVLEMDNQRIAKVRVERVTDERGANDAGNADLRAPTQVVRD